MPQSGLNELRNKIILAGAGDLGDQRSCRTRDKELRGPAARLRVNGPGINELGSQGHVLVFDLAVQCVQANKRYVRAVKAISSGVVRPIASAAGYGSCQSTSLYPKALRTKVKNWASVASLSVPYFVDDTPLVIPFT